jgi:hypothetical protein
VKCRRRDDIGSYKNITVDAGLGPARSGKSRCARVDSGCQSASVRSDTQVTRIGSGTRCMGPCRRVPTSSFLALHGTYGEDGRNPSGGLG